LGGYILFGNLIDNIGKLLKKSRDTAMTESEFFEIEIQKWLCSKKRCEQIKGVKYYAGLQDILKRKREVIGQNGELTEVTNLPNNKILDNQYSKMVDQKSNYLFGKPFTIETENENYLAELKNIFGKKFKKTLQNIAENALNCGIAWVYVYYNEDGELSFKHFEPFEILPFWKDSEHTELDVVVRVYDVEVYEGSTETIQKKVEFYRADGVKRYVYDGSKLVPDIENLSQDYIIYEDETGITTAFNWGKIPIIPFKINDKEIPLIRKIKSLQDGINEILSDFQNNMQEDCHNTILVIKN
jgi:SPP1 family phage portal protein